MVPSTYAPSPGLAATPSLPFGLRGGDGFPPVLAWGSGTVPVGHACPAYVSSLAKGITTFFKVHWRAEIVHVQALAHGGMQEKAARISHHIPALERPASR